MKPTNYGYRKWRKHVKECLGDTGHRDFVKNQWDLYWAGVRDIRLHDCAVWLIDRYGYRP